MRNQLLWKGLVLLALGCVGPAWAAVNLTVSPAIITNDYVGKITLAITGLTSGQSVGVEKFADANNNGTIDPGEPVLQRFKVSDGKQVFMGGVRALNVPGDEDGATNSQIRVELFCPALDPVMDRLEGSFVYRISDATSGAILVTKPFTVRQKALPQGIRGRVTAAGTGLPLTNTSVILMNGMGIGQSGTIVVSNGYYTLRAAPGNYQVMPFRDGYVGDMSVAGATVVTNEFVTNNFALIPGTNTVSGTLIDVTKGIGVGGVGIVAESSSNLFAFTFSDTNGNFTLRLLSGQWKIGCNSSQLPLLGLVGAESKTRTNITGNVSGLNLQVYRANAMIYGYVTDDQTNALSGIGIYSNDTSSQNQADGVTYPPNGAYSVGVLAGQWHVGPDSDQLTGSGYTGSNTDVTVDVGQAVRADFILQKVTAYLTGQVVDEYGPVSSITVGANGTNNAWMSTQTDGDGYFNLGVSAGNWRLSLSTDDAQSFGLISSEVSLNVTNGETRSNLVFSVRHLTAHITGNVCDSEGNPLTHIGVYATVTIDGTLFSAYMETDGSGNYTLPVCDGTWSIGVDCSGLQARGYDCPANRLVAVSGSDKTANFTAAPPAPLQAVLGSPRLLPGGLFSFTISGTPGRTFDVLASTNLVNWGTIYSTNPPGGTCQVAGPIQAGYSNLFFRVWVH